MPAAERYDAVVIGSGEGGKYLAWHLSQAGEKVAVIERRWIGGSCPNINCLPSKNEIWSAGVADMVARIGMSEAEARAANVDVRVARIPMKAVLRTRTTSETAGFMKALVDNDDRIGGFTMIGSEAGEVMAVVQAAMLGELLYTALRDAVLAHPTMAEGLNALFGQVNAR